MGTKFNGANNLANVRLSELPGALRKASDAEFWAFYESATGEFLEAASIEWRSRENDKADEGWLSA